jgi:transposase
VERLCPAVATAAPLLRELRGIIRQQAAQHLDSWLEEAAQCEIAEVATFAAGLQRERSELRVALELPWSTGPVEGQITRLKLVKRQGYGRASLTTLKRRFLHAA